MHLLYLKYVTHLPQLCIGGNGLVVYVLPPGSRLLGEPNRKVGGVICAASITLGR